MAVITPDRFDPIRRYVSVRLAQGVPLVDADWNELDDMRRWELRAFLRWFVGDGVPSGNDGFRITATGAADDFIIVAGGVGLAPLAAGRILVNGMELFIADDIDFTAQPLHEGQVGAAALAANLGVPVIAAVPVPPAAPATRTLTVYLDVWERLVTPDEDPSLILPALGTESCSRVRREWVVRVRAGGAAPVSGDGDHIAGHSYYALARIVQTSAGAIQPVDLTDLRRRGVQLSSQLDFAQVVGDVLGVGYVADGTGTPQLAFSMRDVMNAMLADRPAAVGPFTLLAGGPFLHPAMVVDSHGQPWLFWVRIELGTAIVSFTRRIAGVWSAVVSDAFTIPGFPVVSSLSAAAHADGSLRLFWTQRIAGTHRVFSRRGTDPVWDPIDDVELADDNDHVVAVADAAGVITAAWRSTTGGNIRARTRRYTPVGAGGATEGPPGLLTNPADMTITLTPAGIPELFYVETPAPMAADWAVHSTRRTGGAWGAAFAPMGVTLPVTGFADLAVGYGPGDVPRAYYANESTPGFERIRSKQLALGATEIRDLTPPDGNARHPSIVTDADGNAQLFFENGAELQLLGFIQKV